jgi:VWFA-related protein
MSNVFVAVWLVAVSAFPVVFPQQAPRQPAASDVRTRDVYVSVVDSKGAPAEGLTAADFAVREDGVAREVVRAAPATAPMQIVLLVDDSEALTPALQPMREGLTKFVDQMNGHAEIGIVTVGERSTSLVPSTTDANLLKRGINRIFARPGSGAYLLDAIEEVSNGFAKRKSERPVMVAVTLEGVQFSYLKYDRVLKTLEGSGATLHVLSVGMPSPSMADEMRNVNMTVAEGTRRTGGRRDQVMAISGIPQALQSLGNELLHQYVVTYGRPDTLIPPEKIQVTVTRPGLTARARTRIPGR